MAGARRALSEAPKANLKQGSSCSGLLIGAIMLFIWQGLIVKSPWFLQGNWQGIQRVAALWLATAHSGGREIGEEE